MTEQIIPTQNKICHWGLHICTNQGKCHIKVDDTNYRKVRESFEMIKACSFRKKFLSPEEFNTLRYKI